MIPPSIETSTREERQAYVREKWVPPAPEHQLERKNVCTTASYAVNATFSKGVTQKFFMLIILKEGDHT